MTQTQQQDPLRQAQDSAWAVAAREMRTRDADAAIYEDFFTDFQSAVEFRNYCAALGNAPAERALEVACGTGRTLDLLTAPRAIGIDFSLKELRIARSRFPQASLIQASATHLPFKDGVFDQVLCAGLLLHMPSEQVRLDVLREMGRVSARPARLAIATHAYSWVVSRMFAQDREEHDLFWHRTTAPELERLAYQAFAPACIKTWAICHLPRWRIGNKLGRFSVWLDGVLSKLPGLKHLSGTIVIAQVDLLR